MIRHPALQRPLAHLALLAILLMALLPTLGRLAQSSARADAMPDMAMCTAAGMAQMPMALFDHHAPAPDAGQPGNLLHPDCDYCPLLASLVLTLLAIALALLRTAVIAESPLRRPTHLARFHPCGLGSRGPPLAL